MKLLFTAILLLPMFGVAQDVKSVEISTTPAERNYFGLSIGLNTSGDVSASSIRASSGATSLTGSYSASANSAGSFAAEGGVVRPKGFAYNGGLMHDAERKIESGKANFSGATFPTTSQAIFSFTSIYANAVLHFGIPYLFFGINSVIASSFRVSSGSISGSGSTGHQIGGGAFINPNLALELFFRKNTAQITVTEGTATVNYGTVEITNTQVRIKYLF